MTTLVKNKDPSWLIFAKAEIGQHEKSGAGSNPRILEYRKITKILLEGDDGDVPWCAIFVNAMFVMAKIKGTGSGMARSFCNSSNFVKLKKPTLGCVTVVSSSRGANLGHVFLYAGENDNSFKGLGGNQNDSVNISLISKKRLVGHYWPKGLAIPKAKNTELSTKDQFKELTRDA